jgi:hypothetical protein
MTKITLWTLAAALSLAPAAPTFAQSTAAGGQAQGQASGQAEMKPIEANATADAQAQASADAMLETQKRLEAVKSKGAKVSADARAKADAKLAASAKKADDEARARGDASVAERLAVEFGMTTDALMAEKQELGCSWGQLMIAHSLDANTNTEITVAQIFELHKEGTGWGQIAAGLGLKLGEVVSAAQAEARVATGLAKADGKIAVIHGEGARAGVGANAGANAGTRAGGTQVGTNAGAGVGVGIKVKP